LNILISEQNHTIINAILEVIVSLLSVAENQSELKFLRTDDQKMTHKGILLSSDIYQSEKELSIFRRYVGYFLCVKCEMSKRVDILSFNIQLRAR
jgi:hypothetical protein